MKDKQVEVNGLNVKYKKINKTEYISLTDIARYANPTEPKIPIQTWMRNKDVILYLGLWEKLNNPDFKGIEFTTFENQVGRNSFYLSPQKWIETTGAIGLISKSGIMAARLLMQEVILSFRNMYRRRYPPMQSEI